MEQDIRNQYPNTVKQQSAGAIIAIIVVLSMIIIGAFYALGKHTRRGYSVTQHTTATTVPITTKP